jgi:hypothetical protein
VSLTRRTLLTPARREFRRRLPHYAPDRGRRIEPQYQPKLDQFDYRDPVRSVLDAGHEPLGPAESLGDLSLGQAGALPPLDQQASQFLMLRRSKLPPTHRRAPRTFR